MKVDIEYEGPSRVNRIQGLYREGGARHNVEKKIVHKSSERLELYGRGKKYKYVTGIGYYLKRHINWKLIKGKQYYSKRLKVKLPELSEEEIEGFTYIYGRECSWEWKKVNEVYRSRFAPQYRIETIGNKYKVSITHVVKKERKFFKKYWDVFEFDSLISACNAIEYYMML